MENRKHGLKRVGFVAEGTTCDSCAEIIRKQALQVEGVQSIEYDLASETGYVTFDESVTDIDTILSKVEEKGYTCYILEQKDRAGTVVGWLIGITGFAVVIYFLFQLFKAVNLPQLSPGIGYGLLFVVGLLTGIHCVSMCGGFVVSYTAKHAQEGRKSYKSHLFYGVGKVVSYTLIGAIFGFVGSIIAFTPVMRGFAGIFAGIFLVLFGLRMLGLLPWKISLPTPKFFTRLVGKKSGESSPLIIGLLNGLMIACGPLQAIYIMAAGTGSMIEGAKLLLVFSLGTLPVMLGFGYFTSFVSAKVTHRILKLSGAIVIVLGVLMLNNGLALTGKGYDFGSIVAAASADSSVQPSSISSQGYQEIRMDVVRQGWSPNKFVLQKDVPVRWIINGKEITSCNNAIQVPKLGLSFDIKPGEQVIEFTPTEEGIIPWSCWMGMIPGTFIVKADTGDPAEVQQALNSVPVAQAGSCGGSCGSPSCGAGGSCGCGG